MNALPVGPEQMADAEIRTRYFEDLEKWGFDLPYIAYYAFSFEDVTDKYKQAYTEFAAEAKKRGYPACIQIQITVCAGDKVGIEDAQYDIENNPVVRDDGKFFASFSSDAWRDYLEELTTIFVRQYGYDWVIFEEPMYDVDIPGSKDKFYSRFIEDNPDVQYPTKRDETTEYLKVQEVKADTLVKFCHDLSSHAKSVGAKRTGVMPWFFIPTIENTPKETLNPSCNINRIAQIPELDMLVVRMQPDNIYCETMRTGDDLWKSPKLYYAETMAHALGKDLIVVSNPTDEHAENYSLPLIPIDFFRDSILSTIAAAPSGLTRHWYQQNYGKDTEHMKLFAEANSFTSRLGRANSPVAFVFSYSGTRHSEPYTYETVFPFYWTLAKRLMLEDHMPMLTFFADTLEENLAQHPEVQVLILDEHFPLSMDQMMVISRWWQNTAKRAVVAFGSGLGYVADVNQAGLQPCGRSFPGVFELIGLKQEDEPVYKTEAPISLRDTSRIRRSAFLGGEMTLDLTAIANVRRVFGSRANVLYEAGVEDTKIPVVAEWRDRATLAVFCGFGISDNTAEAAEKAIQYALKEVDAPPFILDSCTEGILWNINRNNYIIISNLSDKEGQVVGRPGRANFWDCREQKMLSDGDVTLNIAPKSFKVYREVGRRSKFFDILGISSLGNLIDGAGRADIEILAGKKTVLVLRASPREIAVDGKPSTISQEIKNGAYHVTLLQCPPGERRITLKW